MSIEFKGYGFSDGLLVTADEKAGAEASPPASSLGNERSFRPWKGQLSSIPAYQVLFGLARLTKAAAIVYASVVATKVPADDLLPSMMTSRFCRDPLRALF